ncbi:MAG: IS21 family transposase [Chloroflexi bacterium]|nr:IS21 family transposase [Chloroflexota bacterium]
MTTFIQSREEFERLLVTMHAQGWSIRGLVRHFSVSRNMVRRILRKHQANRDQGHDIVKDSDKERAIRPSKLDPFVQQINQLIEKYPKITAQRVFEEIKDCGYTGGVSILRERLRVLRPTPKKTPIIRFETEPGLQGQMDWSPYTINFSRTGKSKVNCYSYILGFSRRHHIDFVQRRDFFTLIRRHQDSFAHFNGVPKQCLYDSEKTVVLRWEAGKPVFNPSFSAFITHYCCRPIACRRGRPETKGKVEAPFQYIEKNLLNGRNFKDLDDLRGCARWWLRERSDTHIHDTTGRPPLELFLEQEQQALQPLPYHPYDSSEVALRICSLEGYIEFDTNLYPVPYEHVADILTMKATEHEVSIYSADLALLVCHERIPAGSGIKLDGHQIHGSRKIRYGLEPVRDQFIALGDNSKQFLKGLQDKQPRNCGFHARYVLQQKETYHCDDINHAMGHACRYHAYDCKAIERILKAKAAPRTLESIRNQQAAEKLREALPQIKQRSLSEYSTLLGGSTDETKTDIGQLDQDKGQLEDPET